MTDLLYGQLIKLLNIERQLTAALVAQGENMDSTVADLLARIDTATNAIAAKIQALIDKANAAGSATAADIAAALSPEVDKLEAMGKSESV